MTDEQIREIAAALKTAGGEYMEAGSLAMTIRMLDFAGFAVLPKEATEGMCQAAHRALYYWREANGDPQQDPDNMTKHAIRYRGRAVFSRSRAGLQFLNIPEPHNWERDKRPLPDCLKAWHAQPHIGSRANAAAELRVPISTYDGWCAGKHGPEGLIRRLMTLIDET